MAKHCPVLFFVCFFVHPHQNTCSVEAFDEQASALSVGIIFRTASSSIHDDNNVGW